MAGPSHETSNCFVYPGAIMTSLEAYATNLRSRLLAFVGFGRPSLPLLARGLDPDTQARLRTLHRKYRHDPGLFRQGVALHRLGKSQAQLNAMFDEVTDYVWDVWSGPYDVSSPEERRVREKILVAILLLECRAVLERHPSLLAYIMSDEA